MELSPEPLPALLDRLAPSLVEPLFPKQALARLQGRAAGMPPGAFLLFERHLDASRRLDLSIGHIPPATARSLGLPERYRRSSGLEYDLDDEARLPARFVTLPGEPAIDEAALLALAEELAGPLAAPRLAALARATAAQRPGESWISHIGAMAGRPGAPIRINAGGADAEALRAFAIAAGLDIAPLDRLLALVAGLPLTTILAFDLASEPGPRIGLECYAYPPAFAMPALLDRLVAQELCAKAEAAAMLAWPGGDGPVRTINHVKLVVDGTGPIAAKAYLAVHHRARQAAA